MIYLERLGLSIYEATVSFSKDNVVTSKTGDAKHVYLSDHNFVIKTNLHT